MKLWIVMLTMWLQHRSSLPALDLTREIISSWGQSLRDRMGTHDSGWSGFLLWILAPLLTVGLVLHFLQGMLWGLVADGVFLLLAMVFLVPVRLESWQATDESAFKGDIAEPNTQGKRLELRYTEVQDQVLRAALRHTLAPFFWLVVLGPLGLMVYALLVLAQETLPVTVPWVTPLPQLLAWADWLPGRCMVISAAMLSDFGQGVDQLKREFTTKRPAEGLLADLLGQTLKHPEFGDNDEEGGEAWQLRSHRVQMLLKRVQVFWVVMLAILTIYAPLS
ncbi:MAG: hypothetical protein HKM02_05830 [Pseudomonadales bacterium]|nr:hypothetical protein [Pseudomonadales bacterium]